MNSNTKLALVSISTVIFLSACATPPRVAIKKTHEIQGQKLELGGTYDQRANELVITVNDDPVMRGRFPPFTPTTKLNGTYKGYQITADCYFGSVLGSRGGKLGIIAGAIQNANSKASDKCDVSVNSRPAETLFF